jgi:hypothetical protein
MNLSRSEEDTDFNKIKVKMKMRRKPATAAGSPLSQVAHAATAAGRAAG